MKDSQHAHVERDCTILHEQSDEELLFAYAASGDPYAFDELVRRHDVQLTDHLRRYLGDSELAQDAAQAAWLKLHLKCHTFKPGRRLRPWLYRIAINQAIDAVRSRRRHRMDSLEYPLGGPLSDGEQLRDTLASSFQTSAELVERGEWCAQVRRAVGRLPRHLRQLVRLIFFEGLKYREAAQLLEIPEGTVKSRMHTAFSQLQGHLTQLAS